MIAIALVVALVIGFIFAHRAGMVLEIAAMLGTGAFMVFIMSKVPGSPTACLHEANACQGHVTSLTVWVMVVPLGVACVVDMLKRGKVW
jgi:hypothetical protein